MFRFSCKPVQLTKYKAINAKYAREEIPRIESLLKKYGYYTEYQGICGQHIGATAIPGSVGKPMIDLVFCTNSMLPKISNKLVSDLE